MSDDSAQESLTKREQHRAKVRQWFAEHPGYSQEYAAKQKQFRTEMGVSKSGTIPVPRIKGKLPYSVTITNPLTEEEKICPPDSQPAKRRPSMRRN